MAAVYPGALNTFIPDHNATNKMVVDFARNINDFPLNRYCQIVPVKAMRGYYLDMTIEEAGRIIDSSGANFVWADGDPRPEPDSGTEKHEYKPYECIRRAPMFKMGTLTIEQASWDIVARHAARKAQQAMTLRTQLAVTQLLTSGNYNASHALDVTSDISGVTGTWAESTTARTDIKRSIIAGIEQILDSTLNGVAIDDLILVISSDLAGKIAVTQELVDYVKGSPDALAQIRGDMPNRNKYYGLPAELYGVELVVEDTRKVTSKKGATRAVSQIFTSGYAALVSRPGGLVGVADAPSFSTLTLFAQEEMTVEKMDDTNNRRVLGSVVDTVDVKVSAPASGILFSNCS